MPQDPFLFLLPLLRLNPSNVVQAQWVQGRLVEAAGLDVAVSYIVAGADQA